MSDVGLTLTQLRYDQKIFWRNPMSVFFTVVQPLIFLVIFVSVFGNDTTTVAGHVDQPLDLLRARHPHPGDRHRHLLQPHHLAHADARERRAQAHPEHARCRRGASSSDGSARRWSSPSSSSRSLAGVGRVAYGVSLPTNALPGVLVALIVGVAAFACLAFAVTAFVPSVDAAAPIVNVIVLPLLFISGIFIPNDELPEGMQRVADIFPIKHLFTALLTAFDPATQGSGVSADDLAVIAAWALFGLVVALRYFRWTPKAT